MFGRNRGFGVALVVDQNALHRAVLFMGGNKNGEAVLQGGEFPFPEHQVRNVVFNLPFQVGKGLFRIGNGEVVDVEAENRHRQAEINRRSGVLPGADARRLHNHQFAVGKHPVVNEQNRHEYGNRRQQGKQPGHQAGGHFDEQTERQSLVGDQFDKTQRLSEPQNRHQRKSDQKKPDKYLAGNVNV